MHSVEYYVQNVNVTLFNNKRNCCMLFRAVHELAKPDCIVYVKLRRPRWMVLMWIIIQSKNMLDYIQTTLLSSCNNTIKIIYFTTLPFTLVIFILDVKRVKELVQPCFIKKKMANMNTNILFLMELIVPCETPLWFSDKRVQSTLILFVTLQGSVVDKQSAF